MRNGWEKDNLYMIISAGFTPEKKAHQHGDMLGIGAYAYGNVILPNYQVRYYLEDLPEFKNSWVKNVALIDSIPQGMGWKGNKGGSGFGQWEKLPMPKVLAWKTNAKFDFFVGSHDGYKSMKTDFYRSVLFIKDGFWIVTDKINGNNQNHSLQQVWQGHYDVEEDGVHARSVFPNGAGLEIIQLGSKSDRITKASARSKGRIVFETKLFDGQAVNTLLFPFENFENRLIIDDYENFKVQDWYVGNGNLFNEKVKSDAQIVVNKGEEFILIGVKKMLVKNQQFLNLKEPVNIWITIDNKEIKILNCDVEEIVVDGKRIDQGATISINI